MKVLDSLQRLPDGTTLVRWHLLDNNYQLIKPVERFLRFKQRGGSATGTIKTYAEKLQALWQYFEVKRLDWHEFELRYLADFGYWYLTGGLLLDGSVLPFDSDNIPARRNEKTVNLAQTAVTQFYEFHALNGTVEDKQLREYRMPRGAQHSGLLAGYRKQLPIGCKKVRYKESHKFPGCLTQSQILNLIDACRTARDKLILWLLADTGMRKGELLGLHLSDVNWNSRIISIVRRENPNHAYAKGRERDLSIAGLMRNAQFCEIVSEYLDEEYPHKVTQQLGHNMMFVVLHQGSPSYGQPLEPQNLNKLLQRLKQKTGIDVERLYPHQFRHTFATHNIKEGRRKGKEKETIAKSVQRQLGHKSIATTLDTYDHSFNEDELKRVVKSNDTGTETN